MVNVLSSVKQQIVKKNLLGKEVDFHVEISL